VLKAWTTGNPILILDPIIFKTTSFYLNQSPCCISNGKPSSARQSANGMLVWRHKSIYIDPPAPFDIDCVWNKRRWLWRSEVCGWAATLICLTHLTMLYRFQDYRLRVFVWRIGKEWNAVIVAYVNGLFRYLLYNDEGKQPLSSFCDCCDFFFILWGGT
jgi:hypothetical protein